MFSSSVANRLNGQKVSSYHTTSTWNVTDSETDEFLVDDSFLTSDLVQSDECSIDILAQISKSIPADFRRVSPELDSEIQIADYVLSERSSGFTSSEASTKTHLQRYGKQCGSISERQPKCVNKPEIRGSIEKSNKRRRSRLGCWTCRLRHKACPEDGDPCSVCTRLGLHCDWAASRPPYMTDSKKATARLKQIRISTGRGRKRIC